MKLEDFPKFDETAWKEKHCKITVNFDPEEVAGFLSELTITNVQKGGHELIFGDDC